MIRAVFAPDWSKTTKPTYNIYYLPGASNAHPMLLITSQDTLVPPLREGLTPFLVLSTAVTGPKRPLVPQSAETQRCLITLISAPDHHTS